MNDTFPLGLEDLMSAYDTHNRRMHIVIDHISENLKSVVEFNAKVVNTLAFYGYDLQAQELLDGHNESFRELHESYIDVIEVVKQLADDVASILELEKEIIQDQMREWERIKDENKV